MIEKIQQKVPKVDTGFREVHLKLDRVETDIAVIKLDISDIKRIIPMHDDRLQNHEVRISNLENFLTGKRRTRKFLS
jgi:hypothetical protein